MSPEDKSRDTAGEGLNVDRDLEIESHDGLDFTGAESEQHGIERDLDRQLADESEDEFLDEGIFNVPQEKKSSSASTKILAALIVLAGVGLGGYIALNPGLLPGKASAPSDALSGHDAGAPQSPQPGITIAENDISEAPPQPTATQNDAPAPDASAAAPPAPPADAASADPLLPPPAAASPSPFAPSQPAPDGAASPTAPDVLKPAEQAAAVPASPPSPEVPSPEVSSPVAAAPSAPPPVAPPPEAAAPAALSAPDANADIKDIARDISPDEAAPRTVAAASPVAAPDDSALKPAEPPPVSGTPAQPASVPPPVSPKQGALPEETKSPEPAAGRNADLYYDSNVNIPVKPMAEGPRKVDPSREPAQKFVIVDSVKKTGDQETMLVSAGRALKLEKYDAALEMYNTLYAKNPRDARILMGRAVAQQNLGMADAAMASYEQLLALTPDNPDVVTNMMGLMRARDPQAALARMQALQRRYPGHPGLAAQIGLTEAEMGNYPEAIRYLGLASALDPSNAQHPFNMAVLADRQGQVEDAIRYYEQALQISAANPGEGQPIPRETVYDRLAELRRR